MQPFRLLPHLVHECAQEASCRPGSKAWFVGAHLFDAASSNSDGPPVILSPAVFTCQLSCTGQCSKGVRVAEADETGHGDQRVWWRRYEPPRRRRSGIFDVVCDMQMILLSVARST